MWHVEKNHHLENAVENCPYVCNITKCSDWIECNDF